jgi:predicted metalloendopeptidase
LGLRPTAITTELPDKYALVNLDKAYSHVYRAAYDALDWVALSTKERIINELAGFSIETIKEVLPNYYSEIRPRFEKIMSEDIVQLRLEKDVSTQNEDNLVKYGTVVAELDKIDKQIINCKPSLTEVHTKIRTRNLMALLWKIALALVGGGVISLIVEHLFFVNNPPIP